LVGGLDVLLRDALRQREGPGEGADAQLLPHVATLLLLLLLAALGLDVQHAVGDRHLDVLLGVDARQLRAHDQVAVLVELVDLDHLVEARPAEERAPERQRLHPLVEDAVEVVEEVDPRQVAVALHQCSHRYLLSLVTSGSLVGLTGGRDQCRKPVGTFVTVRSRPSPTRTPNPRGLLPRAPARRGARSPRAHRRLAAAARVHRRGPARSGWRWPDR